MCPYPEDITQKEYEDVLHVVLSIYRDCNITTLPIDVIGILKHYGFRVYSYSTLREQNEEVFELCCSYTNDSFRWKDIIGYNEKAHNRRINFSLMHELGHVILKTKSEVLCDSFASHIIAPRILIHKFGCRNAEQIHDLFGLSYAAANRVLTDYRKWFHHSYYASFQPSMPELLLAQRFVKLTPLGSLNENCKERFFHAKPSNISIGADITDEMLFAHLKNSYQTRRKASIHGISISEYLMYRYGF